MANRTRGCPFQTSSERKTQPLFFHPIASTRLFYPPGRAEKLSNYEFTIVDILCCPLTFNQATKRYKPQPYPHRVDLIKATQLPDDVQLTAKRMDDALGWRSVVTGELVIYPVPGHHFYMLLEPHVRGLEAQLQQCLQQYQPLS